MKTLERNVTLEAAKSFASILLNISIADLNWVHRPERADAYFNGWSVVVWGKFGKGKTLEITDTTADTGKIILNITDGQIEV